MRILLVEDDETITALVTDFLTHQHYTLDIASNGEAGWELVEAFTYDLILLDIMLPKIDGMTLCRQLRAHGYHMPVLLLTARHTSTDKVMGLDVGADDYLVKPFDLKELGARIRALLRRGNSALTPVLQWGKLQLDPSTCEVTYGSQPLHLSPKEYSLLELFLRNSRRVFSRSAILDHLWSWEDAPGEDTVKAHIKGLRQRFKSIGVPIDLIETVYGMGYRLKPLPPEEQQGLPQIVLAGLPEEIASWLQQRLGSISVQVTSHGEETLDALNRGNWSLLLLDHSVISPKVANVLDAAYSRLKQAKESVIYCLEKNLACNLPQKLVGQILFHPLNWEELAGIIAETLGLTLSPAEESRGAVSLSRVADHPEQRIRQDSALVSTPEETPQLSANNRLNTLAEPLKTAVAELWEKFQGKINSRIAVLEETAQGVLAGKLSDELRQKAIQEAHKLAGSLGTFGFKDGSLLAREIEKLLQPGVSLRQAEALHLLELVAALHRELQNPATPKIPAVPTEQPSGILVNQPPQLLIVEDDIELAQRLAMEVIAWGMQVESVQNLAVARQRIRNSPPDLVLLDLCFPDTAEDGLTLLQELTQQNPPIPVVVLSCRNTIIDRIKAAQLGACAFLQKPMTPAQVMEIVTQVLQQSHSAEFKVMLVDDDPLLLASLQRLLQPWRLKLTTLDDPRQLWNALEATVPDLLVLDVDMPHVNGIELCQVIRNDPKWSSLPVLFLSSHTDVETVQQVFAAGADDFVNKPIAGPELVTRIFNRLERLRLLRSIAEIDILTGVANRRRSTQDLERFLRLAERHHQPLCFAMLELDYFKRVNDEYGHAVGDQVLQRVGKLLLQSFRSEDIVARWGGEEFVVGMYSTTKHVGMQRLVQVLETLRQEEFVQADGRTFHVSFSAGVVQYPEDALDLASLYQSADKVLYQAKTAGRNRVLVRTGD